MTTGSKEPAQVALALSGGGHRASILALGALMALADRGLNDKVCRISSVSGGSITNAVLAVEGDYRAMKPPEVDALAEKLAARVRERHLAHPLGILLALLVPSMGAAYGVSAMGVSWWMWVLAAFIVFLLMLMVTGELVRFGINWLHFDRRSPPRLSELSNRRVVHDFCATDLLTGMPLVFSSRDAHARRRVPVPLHPGMVAVQEWGCKNLQLAAIVRASAAFPGIAPKIIRFREGHKRIAALSLDRHEAPDTRPLGRWVVASDGGVWNNLGTQAIREEAGEDSPPIISVNASAMPKRAKAWRFLVPGIALGAALARIMVILNRNTVEPRVDSIERDQKRRSRTSTAPNAADPLTVVADMRPVKDTRFQLSMLATDTPVVSRWGRSAVTRQEIDDLTGSEWWSAVKGRDGTSLITLGTKLTKLTESECFTLLLRGYVNTFIWSLLVRPLEKTEIAPQTGSALLERLEAVAGLPQ